MPLGDAATRIGASFGPALDMIAEAQRKREPVAKKEDTIYVPELPHIFPIARLAAKSEFVRDVLVVDESKRVKPRLSWYDPYGHVLGPDRVVQGRRRRGRGVLLRGQGCEGRIEVRGADTRE